MGRRMGLAGWFCWKNENPTNLNEIHRHRIFEDRLAYGNHPAMNKLHDALATVQHILFVLLALGAVRIDVAVKRVSSVCPEEVATGWACGNTVKANSIRLSRVSSRVVSCLVYVGDLWVVGRCGPHD